jgi:hypothetical protein
MGFEFSFSLLALAFSISSGVAAVAAKAFVEAIRAEYRDEGITEGLVVTM